LRVDKLVLVNGCSAEFVHDGGTIIIGSTVVQDSPGSFYITGLTQEGNNLRVAWKMSTGGLFGEFNVLQVTAGAADGSYSTNTLTDIFTVSNVVEGGVTNYLDVGGATNRPARYYRIRLQSSGGQ
jgi:hypothetical protein